MKSQTTPQVETNQERQNLQALRQCVQMMRQYKSCFQLLVDDLKTGERYLILERDDTLQDKCIAIRSNRMQCEIMSDCFPVDQDHMGLKINARFDHLSKPDQPMSPSFYEVVDFLGQALADLPCVRCEHIADLTKTRYIWEPDKTNAWRTRP